MGQKKNKKQLLAKTIRRRKILLAVAAAVFLVALVLFVLCYIFLCSRADASSYVYAPFLKSMMKKNFAYFVFMFCLIWGGIVVCVRLVGFEFFRSWMILCFAVFLCAVFVYGFVTLRYHYLDFSREDPVVFEGDFEKDRGRYFVFLDDGTRLWNVWEKTALKKGEYSGTVVYSKRTKYILDIDLTD